MPSPTVRSRSSDRSPPGEELIVVHGPGEFVGDVHMLSGRRSVVRARGRTPGTLIELSRDGLLALIQTDSDLSGILMRAFILRRVELMSSGRGDVVLVGSAHSSGTLRLKEFLSRNGYPYPISISKRIRPHRNYWTDSACRSMRSRSCYARAMLRCATRRTGRCPTAWASTT
jgi:hypothetical protein